MLQPTALFALNLWQCQRLLQISRVKNIVNIFVLSSVTSSYGGLLVIVFSLVSYFFPSLCLSSICRIVYCGWMVQDGSLVYILNRNVGWHIDWYHFGHPRSALIPNRGALIRGSLFGIEIVTRPGGGRWSDTLYWEVFWNYGWAFAK